MQRTMGWGKVLWNIMTGEKKSVSNAAVVVNRDLDLKRNPCFTDWKVTHGCPSFCKLDKWRSVFRAQVAAHSANIPLGFRKYNVNQSCELKLWLRLRASSVYRVLWGRTSENVLQCVVSSFERKGKYPSTVNIPFVLLTVRTWQG